MRLIDADALEQNYDLYKCEKYTEDKKAYYHARDTLMLYEIKWMIDDAPTVDPRDCIEAEPIELFMRLTTGEVSDGLCPECKHFVRVRSHFCPVCGTKLDWSKAKSYEEGEG